MSHTPIMVGLGEVLWDLLPRGKVLGGAPTNFAYMSSLFGNQGIVASRVGNDLLGQEACTLMSNYGLTTSFVQRDDEHETGIAGIFIDPQGQASYTIKHPVAWDYLQWTPAWRELASRVDVVCFGSLAQRSPSSAATIASFITSASEEALVVCDANLREPFYSIESLQKSFEYADILKLNDHELTHIASLLGIDGRGEIELAKRLFVKFNLELLCITRGARGSLLLSDSQMVEHHGISVDVADSIGAGDAFTACVAHYYMEGAPLEEISESANRLAAWVTTQVGATPTISPAQLSEILNLGRHGSTGPDVRDAGKAQKSAVAHSEDHNE